MQLSSIPLHTTKLPPPWPITRRENTRGKSVRDKLAVLSGPCWARVWVRPPGCIFSKGADRVRAVWHGARRLGKAGGQAPSLAQSDRPMLNSTDRPATLLKKVVCSHLCQPPVWSVLAGVQSLLFVLVLVCGGPRKVLVMPRAPRRFYLFSIIA